MKTYSKQSTTHYVVGSYTLIWPKFPGATKRIFGPNGQIAAQKLPAEVYAEFVAGGVEDKLLDAVPQHRVKDKSSRHAAFFDHEQTNEDMEAEGFRWNDKKGRFEP